MKAGVFGSIAKSYPNLLKLDVNTHLFYSDELVEHFPGRIFRVKGTLGRGELKKMKGGNFNVISRNHPAKAPELEKRYRLRSSECNFLIACTVRGTKTILESEKV